MIGVCKFCGCTDSSPCVIPASYITDREFMASLIAADHNAGVPCAWLLPDVCTAPVCVAKAYLEARGVIDQLVAELAAGVFA